MSTMADYRIPNSLSFVKILMMSRNRSEASAERRLQKLHEAHNPRKTSEVVGMLVDQLIEDLIFLEQQNGDRDLEPRRSELHTA